MQVLGVFWKQVFYILLCKNSLKEYFVLVCLQSVMTSFSLWNTQKPAYQLYIKPRNQKDNILAAFSVKKGA
jgi:hypothetical protein